MKTLLLMKALVGAAVAGSLVAGGSAALAKPEASDKGRKMVSINEAGEVRVGGTVSGVSGKHISLSSWLGTWVVDATNAKLNVDSLTDLKIGDKIMASGKLSSGLALVANAIHDFSRGEAKEDGNKVKGRKHIKGTIEDFDESKGTFTLETKKMGEVKVSTSGDTKISSHTTGTLGSLANGMKAMVSGVLDVGAKTMTAFSIKAKN